jgi:hypothetical protein
MPNVQLHISKVGLFNTEDLAHTLYTYSVIISVNYSLLKVEVKELVDVEVILDFSDALNVTVVDNSDSMVVEALVKHYK